MSIKVTVKVERPDGQIVLSQTEVPDEMAPDDPALEEEAARVGAQFRMSYMECRMLPDSAHPAVLEP